MSDAIRADPVEAGWQLDRVEPQLPETSRLDPSFGGLELCAKCRIASSRLGRSSPAGRESRLYCYGADAIEMPYRQIAS